MRFFDHAPVSPEFMWIFGGLGLLFTTAGAVVAYAFDFNTVASVTLTLPCNLFLISLLVSETEEGSDAIFKYGIAFFGAFASACAIVATSLAGEFNASIPLYAWFLASVWYAELMFRALGWTSWFYGLFQLAGWFRGGCPVADFFKPPPIEEIQIIGNIPLPTASTRGRSDTDLYPGVKKWVEPNQPWELMEEADKRVVHVAKCLLWVDRPRGPLDEKREIPGKTARKLRKWLCCGQMRTQRRNCPTRSWS